jgi:hypothetical protein
MTHLCLLILQRHEPDENGKSRGRAENHRRNAGKRAAEECRRIGSHRSADDGSGPLREQRRLKTAGFRYAVYPTELFVSRWFFLPLFPQISLLLRSLSG